MGSVLGGRVLGRPPSATSRMGAPVLGCRSTAILQRLQQIFPIEECKVTPHFVHVELADIGLEQRAEVVEIADSRRVVDVALQFEGDEPFREMGSDSFPHQR